MLFLTKRKSSTSLGFALAWINEWLLGIHGEYMILVKLAMGECMDFCFAYDGRKPLDHTLSLLRSYGWIDNHYRLEPTLSEAMAPLTSASLIRVASIRVGAIFPVTYHDNVILSAAMRV